MADYDSEEEQQEAMTPRKWRTNMAAVVAANKLAKAQAEAKAVEEAEDEAYRQSIEAAKRTVVVSSGDSVHAESRANSVTRQMLSARDDHKAKVESYYATMAKIRDVQQRAAKNGHDNTEKLQSRLRCTRKSREYMKELGLCLLYTSPSPRD